MTSTDDPYQFSMEDSISETPRTRSSTRNRKASNQKVPKKCPENPSKPDLPRIRTRSSQKSPITPSNDESFMSNISSGFSQFVNSKKRQRDEKKSKTSKRPKTTNYADEDEPPTDEIEDIEQVKLVYETAGGRTNLARVAATNAQILANRTGSKANTTYTINVIDDTQIDTLAIPDTMVNNDTQQNDSSWQRDIDRLMRKLDEPSTTIKSQTQIEETQVDEEIIGLISPPQTEKIVQESIQTASTNTQARKSSISTVIQRDEIGIQTENLSSMHSCCQDVSNCPCVLRYSKLERLFMEKISRFISIVPTIPNSTISTENHQKRRSGQNYPRFRRFRGHRRINHRFVSTSIQNNPSTTIEDITDETNTEIENQTETNVEMAEEQNESVHSNDNITRTENVISTTITIEKNPSPIDDLSAIEKLDTTTMVDQTSTLLISSSNNTCSTGRPLVLTTSSLGEQQKSQLRLFLNRFNASSSSVVDASTTHIIVNENSPLVCPLTGKIIQGIARHLFIVSHRWLNECLSENSIVDERPYEIRGDTSLGNDHGGMRRSRLTPSFLLEKYSICLRCSSNDCAPLQTIEQVQELILLSGGKLVRNFSEITMIDNEREMILVLGINGLTGGEKKRKALLDTCQQLNVKCVNIHWLLISIAKFEIQLFENYHITQV